MAIEARAGGGRGLSTGDQQPRRSWVSSNLGDENSEPCEGGQCHQPRSGAD